MNTKLKVGTIVKIRKDLYCTRAYDDIYFAADMESFRGKTAKIISNNGMFGNTICYKIDIDNQRWTWCDKMFDVVSGPEHKVYNIAKWCKEHYV